MKFVAKMSKQRTERANRALVRLIEAQSFMRVIEENQNPTRRLSEFFKRLALPVTHHRRAASVSHTGC
jgi:hypothetical protein